MAQRDNNFDFLRILAATLVLCSHQFGLAAQRQPSAFSTTFGALGVLIFFSISGFLVAQSWRQDPHVLRFAAKRALRIWPGLAAVVLLTTFVLGPLVSSLPFRQYLAREEVWDYLRSLYVQEIRFVLPGVFAHNPKTPSVNGSLWTIPMEVRCYALLLVGGMLGLLKLRWAVLAGTALLGVYHFALSGSHDHFIEFTLFFFFGVCLHLFRDEWDRKPHLLAIAALVAVAIYAAGLPAIGVAIALPIAVVYAGTRSTPVLNRFGRFGDLSYGVYIYAFPVQQTYYWALGTDFPFWPGLLITATATAVLAWLSWHLVERPALDLKRRLPATVAGLKPAAVRG